MRIKILRSLPVRSVDTIDLTRFVPGQEYEVGNRVGELLLAEGWAEPLPDNDPAFLIPFSDADPFMARVTDHSSPPNLVRETNPPYYSDQTPIVPDIFRRRRARGD